MKCLICDKDATTTFTPDMDVKGLSTCEEHKLIVHHLYYTLVWLGAKEFKKFLKSVKGEWYEEQNKQN